MFSRTWSPSINAKPFLEFDKSHMVKGPCENTNTLFLTKGSAKENGALGARSGVAAEQFGAELVEKAAVSIQKFSTYVVASRANLLSWPSMESSFVMTVKNGTLELITKSEDGIDIVLPYEPISVYHTSHIWKACPQLQILPSVQLPVDQLVEFVTFIMRTESQRKNYTISESLKSITLQPSQCETTLLSDVIGAISANRRMVENLCSLRLAGEFTEDAAAQLQELFQLAEKLSVLALSHTSLGRVFETLIPLLKPSKLAVVDMEGNDLGIGNDDNEFVVLLSEYVKENKFLLDLNLNYNNISGENARIFFEALGASDTKYTPQDFADSFEREGHDSGEEEEPELYNMSFFLPESDINEENYDEEDDGEGDEEEENTEYKEELDMEDDNSGYDGEKKGSAKKRLNASALNSSTQDGNDNEEDEEEGEEDNESVEAVGNKNIENMNNEEDEEEEDDEEEDEEDEEKPIPPHILRKFRRLFRSLMKDESKTREACISMYLTEATVLLDELHIIQKKLSEERRIQIELYCTRRSGWSHLQALRLRGNPIGNEGAKAAALVLRHEIELEEEESEQIRTELSGKTDTMLDVLLAERNKSILEESAARRDILLSHRTAWESFATGMTPKRAPLQKNSSNNNSDEDEEEHLGFADTENGGNNFDRLNVETADETMDDENMAAEFAEEQSAVLEEVRGNWDTPFPPTKRGLQALRLLDLSSCQVGTHGMKKISDALQTNNSLEVLLLRNNCFARRRVALQTDDNEDDIDEQPSVKRVDVPHYVSPGCISLCKALTMNKTLRVLDLGYNHMYPETVRQLALALKSNTTLACLSLEGNCMGFNESPYEMDSKILEVTGYPVDVSALSRSSCFFELLQAVYTTSITTLLLGHNDISNCWTDEETDLLAKLCCRLHTLHLNGNGLLPKHIAQWSDAVSEADSFSIRDLNLSRNNFYGEDGGAALGLLLAHCQENLEILNLDETQLGNSGVKCAFGSFKPKTLTSLSIRQVKMTLCESLSLEALVPLRRLIVSDNPLKKEELLKLVSRVSCTALNLAYFSIWSREVEMEEQLPILKDDILKMQQLLFVDFGLLRRFDNLGDARDSLGQLETILVERHLARLLNVNSCDE